MQELFDREAKCRRGRWKQKSLPPCRRVGARAFRPCGEVSAGDMEAKRPSALPARGCKSFSVLRRGVGGEREQEGTPLQARKCKTFLPCGGEWTGERVQWLLRCRREESNVFLPCNAGRTCNAGRMCNAGKTCSACSTSTYDEAAGASDLADSTVLLQRKEPGKHGKEKARAVAGDFVSTRQQVNPSTLDSCAAQTRMDRVTARRPRFPPARATAWRGRRPSLRQLRSRRA